MGFRLGDHLPGALYKTKATTTWGANGNTCTITDPKITPSSRVLVQVTGTTPASGQWSQTENSGSVTITSSDSENTALTLAYIIL